MSVHHVEGFIIDEGHAAQRVDKDYGYDLILFTYDQTGYIEPGLVLLQIKAAEQLRANGAEVVFDLDVRDHNLWKAERMPVILILFDMSQKRAFWIDVQTYFRTDGTQPRRGAKTVRVRVPQRQQWGRQAVAAIRQRKSDSYWQGWDQI